jgi:toxin CcdB
MRRFDVVRNRDSGNARRFPLLLIVQSDFLEGLPTQVVVPMVKTAKLRDRPAEVLNPVAQIDGESYVLLTQQLAAVPVGTLGATVTSLEPRRDDVVRALDFLFSGI